MISGSGVIFPGSHRLGHWIELLKESPKVLFQVLSEARQAADLICPEGELPESKPLALLLEASAGWENHPGTS